MSRACVISRSYLLPLAIAAAVSSACGSFPQPTRPTLSTDPIVGLFTLTVRAESECAVIPVAARNRTYTAAIRSTTDSNYIVTLSDAAFLRGGICPAAGSPGLGCEQFRASREGDLLRFRLVEEFPDDEFAGVGGTIVEVIPPDNWLAVGGTGVGRVDGTAIEASLDGYLWYCTSVRADPLFCRASARCDSNLRLTFVRK
jgi:hypothetical protein